MGEHGHFDLTHIFARATARGDGTREYLTLTWAPESVWDEQQESLASLIDTLSFAQ